METNNKLREALMQIYDRVNSLDENCAVDPVEIRDIAKAALATPDRNCDVGTAEEQAKRLDAFCDSHGHGFDGQKIYCCENCQLISVDRCELAWAQMPYERESESTAKPRVLVIDDARFMLSYAQKFLDFCNVEQEYSIPKDETMLAKYDVIIVDGEGIGNPKYKDGIEFCKAYEKQGNNKGLIYHSGLMPDRADREILKERGIKMLLKGDVPGKFVAAVKEIV